MININKKKIYRANVLLSIGREAKRKEARETTRS